MNILSLTVGPIMTNCYLLCDEERKVCAVIDPGAEAGRIARAVESAGCAPVCILLTHGHYDHTGAVEELLKQYPGIPVYLSRRDQHDGAGSELTRLFPTLPDVTDYDEGDTVPVGGLTVSVLATPGHSAGSVTLLCGNAMFSGDTLFAGSCGRTDLATGDGSEMLSSLARLGRLGGEYRVLPGHMDASLLSRERVYNPYLLHALRG